MSAARPKAGSSGTTAEYSVQCPHHCIIFRHNTMPEIRALAAASSSQRGGLNHQAIEDYLKTIYTLARESSPVSTSRLAEARDVKPASATGMLNRLARLNLVNYEKHRGVTLTDEGERIALEVLRHHRLIELYLIQALGFTWDEVHEQADILEHVISEKLEERIAAVLGYPQFDPHGAPIPSRDGVVVRRPLHPLTTLTAGNQATVKQIVDDSDGALLRYLADMGLQLEVEVTVVAIEPFDGPLTLLIGDQERVIGHRAALAVLVD